METKIRVSREERFLKDKNISDRVYMILFSMANYTYGTDHRILNKKAVNFTKLAEVYPISRQTFAKHLKELIKKGLIFEQEKEYIIPNPEYYYDIDKETIKTLSCGLKDHTIKVYAFLLGWYSHCTKRGETYNFSYDYLCEVIGLTKHQSNRNMMKGILDILQRLGLIVISDTADFPVVLNGNKTYHYRLLFARDSLPSTRSAV